METIKDATGQVLRQVGKEITAETLEGYGPYAPQRKLLGAVVNWDADPVRRCNGDDWFYPGVMSNGGTVMVSRTLQFWFPKD